MRSFGRWTAALAAVAALVLIAVTAADRLTSSTAELVVGLVAVIAIGAFWWFVPTDQRIRQAAQRYALALFDAARLLARDPRTSAVDTREERS